MDTITASLPTGVRIDRLVAHEDSRGCLSEIFRAEWGVGIDPVQWNFVRSEPNVLRGVHVHPIHTDYLILVGGAMTMCLHDIRSGSPTKGETVMVELTGEQLKAVTTPPGVAHGFWYPEASTHFYAVSHYWNPKDEMGCAWTAPELGAKWPSSFPILSSRDAALGSYGEMVEQYVAALRLRAS
jgi:dTDP-4-dehydrorhamnose 3,5-epimerase